MASNKKSTALKAVDGTLSRNPSRHNYDEPVPEIGIGDPPRSLRATEKKIWIELVENHYPGALGEGDRFALEILCRLMFRWRHPNRKNVEPLRPSELSRLTSLLSQFGMTPATRPNIVGKNRHRPGDPTGPTGRPKNRFDLD